MTTPKHPSAGAGDQARIELSRSFERAQEPSHRRFLIAFGATMVLASGTAFFFKLYEFIYTATHAGADAMGSFLIPVLNYLVVAAGFFCLFLWAYFSGQFRDIEGPKYRMLELNREMDELDAVRKTPLNHPTPSES